MADRPDPALGTLDFKSLYHTSDSPIRTPGLSTRSQTSESSFSIVSAGSDLTPDGASDSFSNDSPPPGTTSPAPSTTTPLPSLPAPSAKSLDADIVSFRAATGYRHATWAQTFHSRPEYLVTPQTIQEVQQLVLLARRARRRITCVGSGHSPSDLTCTSSWLVSLEHLSTIHSAQRYPTPRGKEGRFGGSVVFGAGISLHNLNQRLAERGLTIPNLGSIDVQSVAGAIATATHGSSLKHGLLSQNVRGLRIVLADGIARWVSSTSEQDDDKELFHAALVSLGALGIITDLEMEVAYDTNIEWEQRLEPLSYVLEHWEKELWSQAEFVRCWWMPYTRNVVVWKADKTSKPPKKPESSWYGGALGFHSYRFMLYIAHHIPSLLPTVEWFVMGMQYGFTPGKRTNSAVGPMREELLMDCLYSQFVNEWAIPLAKGPEAIRRLDKWLHGDQANSGIPFSSKALYVHAPIEVRISDGSLSNSTSNSSSTSSTPDSETPPHVRGFLDTTEPSGPTLYLNATLYRPFGLDPPCRARYYEAFEYLMRDLGGRPHWAKNFSTVTSANIDQMYGEDLQRWLGVRKRVDQEGMFTGAWLRRNVLGYGDSEEDSGRRPAKAGEGAEARGKGKGFPPGQGGHETGMTTHEVLSSVYTRASTSHSREQESTPSSLLLEERRVSTKHRWWSGGTDWVGEQAASRDVKGGIELEDDEAEDSMGLLETLERRVRREGGTQGKSQGPEAYVKRINP